MAVIIKLEKAFISSVKRYTNPSTGEPSATQTITIDLGDGALMDFKSQDIDFQDAHRVTVSGTITCDVRVFKGSKNPFPSFYITDHSLKPDVVKLQSLGTAPPAPAVPASK